MRPLPCSLLQRVARPVTPAAESTKPQEGCGVGEGLATGAAVVCPAVARCVDEGAATVLVVEEEGAGVELGLEYDARRQGFNPHHWEALTHAPEQTHPQIGACSNRPSGEAARRASSLRTWGWRVRRSPCPSCPTAHPPYVPRPSALDHVDRDMLNPTSDLLSHCHRRVRDV